MSGERDGMTRAASIVLVAHVSLFSGGVVRGEVSVLQRADGSAGTITHFGDDVGIYSDSHGNSGPIMIAPQGPGPAGPHGKPSIGTAIPFGTPPPPNNLTPAPVLPMYPNRPLLPQQPATPSAVAPLPGIGPSSGGRFGK